MLIEFRVENFRSLRDEQVFTMEAGRIGANDDPRPRIVAGSAEPLLPVSVIYGANASGKSNVLAALSFMRSAVIYSHRSWPPDEGVPLDPFAWGPRKNDPSLFEVCIVIDSIRYQYGFLASEKEFMEEWLYAWPNGKKQIWYERDAGVFKFGDNLRGENKLIEEITRPNALFLSAAIQLKHTQLHPAFTWFRSLRPINISGGGLGPAIEAAARSALAWRISDNIERGHHPSLIREDGSPGRNYDRIRSMLQNADIGIVDLRITKPELSDDGLRNPWIRIQLKHKSSIEDAWLPLEEESKGTQMLFRMALPILEAIQDGTTLIVDELEGSLHPSLAQKIVHLFNDPKLNPHNAQLIFTTHDTNLLGSTMGEPTLRRDQVWLTEKDPEGATVLYPLTDYKPRSAENLERGYLQGRYGAIPFLGNFFSACEN
jgi:uncharacterized protein